MFSWCSVSTSAVDTSSDCFEAGLQKLPGQPPQLLDRKNAPPENEGKHDPRDNALVAEMTKSTVDSDELNEVSGDDGSDSPRSEASQRSTSCDSLVEICSTCAIPSVAKEGFLQLNPTRRSNPFSFIAPRSQQRFCVARDGCLEIWSTRQAYDKDSSNKEVISLRDLKDMDQHANILTLKFVHRGDAVSQQRFGKRRLIKQARGRLIKLSAESDSDAGDWFEAIEFVLRSMSMPINYSLREDPVFRPDILQEFQRLVDHCFMSKSTRDRKGAPLPKRLKVVRVVKVQNSTLRREYNRWQCRLTDELKDDDRRQSYHKLSPDVRTSLLDPPMQALPHLDDRTIERWLFHGTNPAALEGIVKANFDLSCSGAGGLYGKGIYCAGCSSKADEYTEADASGVRGLLLCRAMLGKILYSSDASPNVQNLQDRMKAEGYHSLMGDRWMAVGTYREYIFRHKEQLYPEFIIYYQREYEGSSS